MGGGVLSLSGEDERQHAPYEGNDYERDFQEQVESDWSYDSFLPLIHPELVGGQ